MSIKLFPNPLRQGEPIFITSDYEVTKVTLYNSQGKRLINPTISTDRKLISFSDIATGLYFVIVQVKNHNIPIRLKLVVI